MRSFRLNKYGSICIASLVVLSIVQFWLLYNTYELKDRQLYLAEKKLIESDYGKTIKDDKIFPGGEAIMDHYINGSMGRLETLFRSDRKGFDSLRRRMCSQMFDALANANNMDSILLLIKKRHRLKKAFSYGLVIDFVGVTFDGDSIVPLFDRREATDGSGFRIGGTLRSGGIQNLITNLTVSSPISHSYRVTYDLYVDSDQRRTDILVSMIPAFLLSFFSILSVLLLFYLTFRRWAKQKGIADMKSDFINSINHEFHTPLATIMVATKSLKTREIREEQERLETLVEVIQRQSERLNALFGQVLDITGLQSLKLQKTEQPLHFVLERIVSDYRLKIIGTGIKLDLFGAEQDTVLVDEFWFTTMINNLLDNGIKHNRRASKEISVKAVSDKKRVLLTVEDNGVGMGVETRKHIFEKFYRGKEGGVTSNGLGLGLYYVKLCAEAHRWQVWVESEPGCGSRFNISIPII